MDGKEFCCEDGCSVVESEFFCMVFSWDGEGAACDTVGDGSIRVDLEVVLVCCVDCFLGQCCHEEDVLFFIWA